MKPYTLALLRSAGWFPGRSIDIARFSAALGVDGYVISSAAADSFREFGGLTIAFSSRSKTTGSSHRSVIRLDPRTAAEGIYPETVRVWSTRVDADLCPLGEFEPHSTIVIDPCGHIFIGFDEFLSYWGASLVETLDVLTTCGIGMPPLPFPHHIRPPTL